MSTLKDQQPVLYILNRNYSSWSMRPWLGLKAAGVDFKEVLLLAGTPEVPNMGTPQSDKMLLAAGPTGKAPVLHITQPNGEKLIIFESLAIMEYVAEEYPTLWPSDRFQRAYARALATEMASSFGNIRGYDMNIRDRFPFDPALFTPAKAKDLARLESIWAGCRERMVKARAAGESDDGFLFGRFTIVDAMYAPLMFRIQTYGLREKMSDPLALEYVDRVLRYEHVQEWARLALQEKEIIARSHIYPIEPKA
ncbi:Glutathione S-transferase 8 [Actinomortierella ambigua]|nr:Glutathione S-transferase 8 [Actinomortierella ambigua]